MRSLVTVMFNCGIQLFYETVKHFIRYSYLLMYIIYTLQWYYNTYSAWFLDIRIYQLV